MNPQASQNRDREERLGAVLAEWLEAAEQGQPPDESDYLRRYPEFGSELAQCFADWKRFHDPREQYSGTSSSPSCRLPRTVSWGTSASGVRWAGAAWASSTRPSRARYDD